MCIFSNLFQFHLIGPSWNETRNQNNFSHIKLSWKTMTLITQLRLIWSLFLNRRSGETLSLPRAELCGTGDSRCHTMCEHVKRAPEWPRLHPHKAQLKVPSWTEASSAEQCRQEARCRYARTLPCPAEPLVGPGPAFSIRPHLHRCQESPWDQALSWPPHGLRLAPSSNSGQLFGAFQKSGLVLEGRSWEGHDFPGTLWGCLVAAHSDRVLRGLRPHPAL